MVYQVYSSKRSVIYDPLNFFYSFGKEKCPSFTFYYLYKLLNMQGHTWGNFQNILALVVQIMKHFDDYYYIFVGVWFFLFPFFQSVYKVHAIP